MAKRRNQSGSSTTCTDHKTEALMLWVHHACRNIQVGKVDNDLDDRVMRKRGRPHMKWVDEITDKTKLIMDELKFS